MASLNRYHRSSRFVPALLAFLHLAPSAGYGTGEEPENVPVTSTRLESVLIYPSRDAPALAVSLNDTRLGAEITGVLEEIPVQVGDLVAAMAVVARLNCERHLIAVDTATAALEAGRSRHDFNELQLTNARTLSTKRNISQEELDKRIAETRTSKAEIDRLETNLESARLTVRKCEIKAPFDAVVIERIASIGDFVVPGTPIMRLLDDENTEIDAKVQEQDLESLSSAEEVQFLSRQRQYAVKLRTTLPLVESRLRSQEVRLSFIGDKPPPGATGRVQWTAAEGRIPVDLILRRGKRLGIFIRDGDIARFATLDLALPGHPAPTTLPHDTRVILDGRFNLQDGDRVLER